MTLAFAGLTASGQATDAESSPPQPVSEAPPVYVAPTVADRIGRIMAPVYVNGRGPYPFVVDTGASRSAVAPRLLAELGLVPDAEASLALRGVTGAADVPAVELESLQAGEIRLQHLRLPVVQRSIFADADGILGVDGFDRACLYVDFVRQTIAIYRNGCPRFRYDWPRIPAKLRFGRLVVVSGHIKRVAVKAIIDTGAERSLGNEALLHALELQDKAADPSTATSVLGATEQVAPGNLVGTPTLYLGGVKVSDIDVTFGHFDVFRLWQMEDEPALLVGMDLLGAANGLMIDYKRSELRILPGGSSDDPYIRRGGWPGRVP